MPNKNSAKEALKNTGLVGGSQVITILINIVKTKFVAILLGPSGIGLMQLFTSTITLVSSVSGLGIGFSGIRDISESTVSNDYNKLGKTIVILKRWSLATGFLGIFLTIIFSKKLSLWTFGNEDYWIEISLLSCTILFSNIAASYSAIIRGTRRITDFAKMKIISSIIGSIFAIIIFYFYGVKGIVPAIILTGLVTLIINFVFAKKIKYKEIKISLRKSFSDGLSMVQLGIFTVITGFITQLSLYYVRISINDNLGMDEVGYYAVATTLAVTYMGLIFTSMSADYFPKLSAINKDDRAINLAVIEQTKITLLLGTPLIIGMYTFSEYLIQMLYTKEFNLAIPLLMWMLLSVFLRLIGYPIGYVFLAKGKSKIFVFTQTLWNIIFLCLVYLFWQWRGDLIGIGMAFTISYIVGVIVNIIIIKKMTKLKYDNETISYIVFFSIISVLYFYISYSDFNGLYVIVLKIIGLAILSIFSYKKMEQLTNINFISLIMSKFLNK